MVPACGVVEDLGYTDYVWYAQLTTQLTLALA